MNPRHALLEASDRVMDRLNDDFMWMDIEKRIEVDGSGGCVTITTSGSRKLDKITDMLTRALSDVGISSYELTIGPDTDMPGGYVQRKVCLAQ